MAVRVWRSPSRTAHYQSQPSDQRFAAAQHRYAAVAGYLHQLRCVCVRSSVLLRIEHAPQEHHQCCYRYDEHCVDADAAGATIAAAGADTARCTPGYCQRAERFGA